jgi:hypothetical protein
MLDSTKGSARPVLPSVVDPDGCVLLETRIGHFDRASEQRGRVLPLSVVDNSDISPNRLTVFLDSPYPFF